MRNSAYYHYFRKAPSIKEVHQAFSHWDVPISSDATGGQLYENEELRSLWLIKRCLEEVSRQRILNLVQYLQELASTKEESAGWYFVLLLGSFFVFEFSKRLHRLFSFEISDKYPRCSIYTIPATNSLPLKIDG